MRWHKLTSVKIVPSVTVLVTSDISYRRSQLPPNKNHQYPTKSLEKKLSNGTLVSQSKYLPFSTICHQNTVYQ